MKRKGRNNCGTWIVEAYATYKILGLKSSGFFASTKKLMGTVESKMEIEETRKHNLLFPPVWWVDILGD